MVVSGIPPLSLHLLAQEHSLCAVSLKFLCDLGLSGVSSLVLVWVELL